MYFAIDSVAIPVAAWNWFDACSCTPTISLIASPAASTPSATMSASAPFITVKSPAASSALFPAPFTSSPKSSISFPSSSAVWSNWLDAFLASSNSVSYLPKSFFVFSISLCKALYCSFDTSPLANCSCTCFSASSSICSFSSVAATASVSRSCFCAHNVTLPLSNFNSLSTCLSSDCNDLLEPFTLVKAFDSSVVSPPISMVIPFILEATRLTPSSQSFYVCFLCLVLSALIASNYLSILFPRL